MRSQDTTNRVLRTMAALLLAGAVQAGDGGGGKGTGSTGTNENCDCVDGDGTVMECPGVDAPAPPPGDEKQHYEPGDVVYIPDGGTSGDSCDDDGGMGVGVGGGSLPAPPPGTGAGGGKTATTAFDNVVDYGDAYTDSNIWNNHVELQLGGAFDITTLTQVHTSHPDYGTTGLVFNSNPPDSLCFNESTDEIDWLFIELSAPGLYGKIKKFNSATSGVGVINGFHVPAYIDVHINDDPWVHVDVDAWTKPATVDTKLQRALKTAGYTVNRSGDYFIITHPWEQIHRIELVVFDGALWHSELALESNDLGSTLCPPLP